MLNLLLQALVPLPMTSVQEAAWPEAAGSEAAPPQGGASDTLRTTVQGSGPVLSCDLAVCQVCCSLAAAMSHASPSAEQSDLRNLRQHSLACSSWHQRLPASCTRTVFPASCTRTTWGHAGRNNRAGRSATSAREGEPAARRILRHHGAGSGAASRQPLRLSQQRVGPFRLDGQRPGIVQGTVSPAAASQEAGCCTARPAAGPATRSPPCSTSGWAFVRSRGCAVASWLLACPWLLLSRY